MPLGAKHDANRLEGGSPRLLNATASQARYFRGHGTACCSATCPSCSEACAGCSRESARHPGSCPVRVCWSLAAGGEKARCCDERAPPCREPERPAMFLQAQWKEHLRSRMHKRAVARVENRERLRLWRERQAAGSTPDDRRSGDDVSRSDDDTSIIQN